MENNNNTAPPLSPVEREADNEATRLMEHIQDALAAVATHLPDDGDEIEAAADRIERASRDLVFALREVARERSTSAQS
jgi:hypothetical protein